MKHYKTTHPEPTWFEKIRSGTSYLSAKKALVLLLAFSMVAQPLLVQAQTTYKFFRYVPELVVTQPSSPSNPPQQPAPVGSPGTNPPPAQGTAQLSLSANSLAFGQVTSLSSQTRTVLVGNTGTADFSFSATPAFTGDEVFSGSSNCSGSLSPGQSCQVSVTFTPTGALAYQGQLTVATSAGTQTVTLTGQGTALPGGEEGVLVASPSADFGNPSVGSTVQRTFTFTNVGGVALSGLFASVQGSAELNIVSNSCGTQASPASVLPGRNCFISVRWAPTSASSLTGSQVSVNGSFAGAPATVALSGVAGTFSAQGAWTSSLNSVVAPTSTLTTFSTLTSGTGSQQRSVYLRNVGTHGAMAASFRLQGDTEHFELVSVARINNSGTSASCGATVSVDKLSTTVCTALDVATSGSQAHMAVALAYKPKSVGTHQVSLVPTSSNGTQMPAALTFTGSGQLNPQGQWSAATGSYSAYTPAQLAFGTRTANSTATSISVNLRNIGTHGPLSAAFSLTGDTSRFQITSVATVDDSGNTTSCVSGGGLLNGGLSTQSCTAYDPSVGAGVEKHVRVTIRFTPDATSGSHTATLNVASSNSSADPGALTFTAATAFDPQAVWSGATGSTTAVPSSTLNIGTVAAGSAAVTRTVFLRNTGSYGGLAASMLLTGDTDRFRIISVSMVDNSGNSAGCVSGGNLVDGGISANSCTAQDPLSGAGADRHIQVSIRYTPSSVAGSHSVTLSVPTTNSSVAPGSLTFTAATSFDPTAVWSTSTSSTVAPTAANRTFPETLVNGGNDLVFFLRNTGSVGPLSVGLSLTGDTTHFRIVSVQEVSSAGAATACAAGGVVAADGLSATACTADPINGGNNPHIRVQVRYEPKSGTAHTAALNVSTNNATALPAALSLSGTASMAGVVVGQSCLQALQNGYTTSGVYTIAPPGQSARAVYCDQTTLGGGWTLVASLNSTSRFFVSTSVDSKGDVGNATPMPTDAASKVSDVFWAAIPGSMTRFDIAKTGNNRFYVRYGTNVPWSTATRWNSNGGNATPQCSVDGSTWTTGRQFHVADCYTGSETWRVGFMANGVYGMGHTGSSNAFTGTAWVR